MLGQLEKFPNTARAAATDGVIRKVSSLQSVPAAESTAKKNALGKMTAFFPLLLVLWLRSGLKPVGRKRGWREREGRRKKKEFF